MSAAEHVNLLRLHRVQRGYFTLQMLDSVGQKLLFRVMLLAVSSFVELVQGLSQQLPRAQQERHLSVAVALVLLAQILTRTRRQGQVAREHLPGMLVIAMLVSMASVMAVDVAG